MKSDEDVELVAKETPILFAIASDIFITELTMRAWIHTKQSKRRILLQSDIAQAISESDMFDFLIDIVPRVIVQRKAAGSDGGRVHEYGGGPELSQVLDYLYQASIGVEGYTAHHSGSSFPPVESAYRWFHGDLHNPRSHSGQ